MDNKFFKAFWFLLSALTVASPWLVHADMTVSTQKAPQTVTELSGAVWLKYPEKLVYNGNWYYEEPEVEFEDPQFSDLQIYRDYYVYIDGYEAGPATLYVEGTGNYSGVLTAQVEILKGILEPDMYKMSFDSYENFTYSGYSHTPNIMEDYYVSGRRITYTSTDAKIPDSSSGNISEWGEVIAPTDSVFSSPIYPGHYDVWVEVPESRNFRELPRTKVGSFQIFEVDQEQIAALEQIEPTLMSNGFTGFNWNVAYESTSSLRYNPVLSFMKGRIVSIDLSGRFSNEGGKVSFPPQLFLFNTLREMRLSNNSFGFDTSELKQMAAYLPQCAEVLRNLETLDLSRNRIAGSINDIIEAAPNLKNLYLDYNRISDASYPLPSNNDVYETNISFRGMELENVLEIDFNNLNAEELFNSLPSISYFSPYGESSNINLVVSEVPVENIHYNDFGIMLGFYRSYSDFGWYKPEYYGYPIYKGPIENIFYAATGSEWFGVSYGPKMKAKVKFRESDANMDGKVNVADVQSIANHIIEYNSSLFNFSTSDLNGDERIDARDLVLYVNHLLASEPQQFSTASDLMRIMSRKSPSGSLDDEDTEAPSLARIYQEGDLLILETNTEVAALDLAVTCDNIPEWSTIFRDAGMAVNASSDKTWHRILAYSPNAKKSLSAGRHILAIGFSGYPIGGSLSDSEASEIPLQACIATGINNPSEAATSATSKDNFITVNSIGGASWRLISLSGLIIGEGEIPSGVSILPCQKPSYAPVILIISDETGSHTFKL